MCHSSPGFIIALKPTHTKKRQIKTHLVQNTRIGVKIQVALLQWIVAKSESVSGGWDLTPSLCHAFRKNGKLRVAASLVLYHYTIDSSTHLYTHVSEERRKGKKYHLLPWAKLSLLHSTYHSRQAASDTQGQRSRRKTSFQMQEAEEGLCVKLCLSSFFSATLN